MYTFSPARLMEPESSVERPQAVKKLVEAVQSDEDQFKSVVSKIPVIKSQNDHVGLAIKEIDEPSSAEPWVSVQWISIPGRRLGLLTGTGDSEIRRLMVKYNVEITPPPGFKKGDKQNTTHVKVSGVRAADVRAAASAILKNFGEKYKEIIDVPYALLGRLIGKNGSNINDLLFRHKVRVWFPRKEVQAEEQANGKEMATVEVTGDAPNVADAVTEILEFCAKYDKKRLPCVERTWDAVREDKDFFEYVDVPVVSAGKKVGKDELAELYSLHRRSFTINVGGLGKNSQVRLGKPRKEVCQVVLPVMLSGDKDSVLASESVIRDRSLDLLRKCGAKFTRPLLPYSLLRQPARASDWEQRLCEEGCVFVAYEPSDIGLTKPPSALAFHFDDEVVVVDVQRVGATYLRAFWESETTKCVFDSRPLTDYLWRMHEIRLNGILDLQLIDCLKRAEATPVAGCPLATRKVAVPPSNIHELAAQTATSLRTLKDWLLRKAQWQLDDLLMWSKRFAETRRDLLTFDAGNEYENHNYLPFGVFETVPSGGDDGLKCEKCGLLRFPKDMVRGSICKICNQVEKDREDVKMGLKPPM